MNLEFPDDYIQLCKEEEAAFKILEGLAVQNVHGLTINEKALINAEYKIAQIKYDSLEGKLSEYRGRIALGRYESKFAKAIGS